MIRKAKTSEVITRDFWEENSKDLINLLLENGTNKQDLIKTLSDYKLTLSIIETSKNEKFLSFSQETLKSLILTAVIALQQGGYDL